MDEYPSVTLVPFREYMCIGYRYLMYAQSEYGMHSIFSLPFHVHSLRPLFPGSNELDQVARIHEIIGSPSPVLLEKFRKQYVSR